MSAKVVLDPKGLVLAPGELSRASGALTVATNVNVEAPGVIRSRNGHEKETTGLGGPVWKMTSTKELGAALLVNHGTSTAATGLKYGTGTSGWTAISGTYTNQPATRMQTAVGNRNHYVTTDEGVRRIESSLSPFYAGMPKALALDLAGPTVLTGTGVVVDDGSSVAYRHTWCKKDSEGRVMEGAPSSRTVVYNNTRTSGYAGGVTKNVVCRILLPTQTYTSATALTTDYFFRLYRSASETVGIVPSDDMNLVYEAFLTSTNISNGYVDVTDATPEAFRALGPALYTNSEDGFGEVGLWSGTDTSLTGILGANNPPPRARDVVLFADCMFYADLLYPPALNLTLLSTVAGTGITAADTLTIGGITYTAIVPGAPANNEFQVFTVAGGSSASEALERTAIDLCRCINDSSTNTTTWAYYVAKYGGLPGVIRLEARTIAGSFTAAASAHGTAFRPDLTSAVSAVADTYANGYAFAKRGQPDAVPSVNVGFLGRGDTSLLKTLVLGESVFMFSDAGLYRLTGRSYADFAVQEFDLSFRLIGRELACVCDDAIYAWGYQGIARITNAGVEYISNAIEPKLLDIFNTLSAITLSDAAQSAYTWLSAYAWSTAYTGRHKVIFAYPLLATGNNKKNCAAALVYDTRMQAWTSWTFSRATDSDSTQGYSTGVARVFDDILYFGQWLNAGTDCYSFKERRAFAAADYKDDNYNQTNQAITKTLVWSALASAPELSTHWDELHILYDVSPTFSAWTTPTALTATFTADLASSSGAVSVAPTAASRMSRVMVTQAQRRSARMTVTIQHSTASEYFGLEGMALVHLPGEGTATVRS